MTDSIEASFSGEPLASALQRARQRLAAKRFPKWLSAFFGQVFVKRRAIGCVLLYTGFVGAIRRSI